MVLLVYSLCGLAILKILIDVVGGEVAAPYSVIVESIIFLILVLIIVRIHVKQREGKRELLQRKINELNQMLSDKRQTF